jgi:hypothetical protein
MNAECVINLLLFKNNVEDRIFPNTKIPHNRKEYDMIYLSEFHLEEFPFVPNSCFYLTKQIESQIKIFNYDRKPEKVESIIS